MTVNKPSKWIYKAEVAKIVDGYPQPTQQEVEFIQQEGIEQ